MNTSKLPQTNRVSRSGFSLVEVVLAVGIMALGVVTILGLLPHGMEISRQTANELAESRIVDSIISDLQAMTWAQLHSTANNEDLQTRLYDDQGLQIDSNASNDEKATELSYVARVEIPEPNVVLPTDGAETPNQNLRRVIIKVAAVPQENFNFDNPGAVPVRTVTQLIA
ncbi:MAG TPA: Verru_Chthon cassette protein B, partial [Prosthecobacter sp.]|nr:Verru_Chthon cassette protein B [Prosthecobacter sp.]